nr:LEAF RUST 10 DISEASE-RESISTANCE LOCUS RECEPTOR-LIKE PROTEIN KINASE-like 1.3 [Arachis hypogaea]
MEFILGLRSLTGYRGGGLLPPVILLQHWNPATASRVPQHHAPRVMAGVPTVSNQMRCVPSAWFQCCTYNYKKEPTEYFSPSRILGQGTFGTVFHGLNIAIEAASALAYLHNSGIIRRDVADFGLLHTLLLVVSTSSQEVTIYYLMAIWTLCISNITGTSGHTSLCTDLMRLCSDLFQSCFPGTSSGTSPNDSIQIKWPILSYRELAKVTNNFDQCNMLGKIGLEKVYHDKKNGREVAIERYSNNEMHIFQQFLYEDLISNILPHKNLVSFHGCAFHHKEFLLAHEYLSNGTLASYLQLEMSQSSTLHWLTRLDIAIDAANALSYLHYHGIVHRNVKSHNILLDKNLCAKLGGLHLSRKLPEGVSIDDTYVTSDLVGTRGYIDPEYVSYGRVGATVDVYSFGVVLCELISSNSLSIGKVARKRVLLQF